MGTTLSRTGLTRRQLRSLYSIADDSDGRGNDEMIDNFAILLTHGLMMLAAWTLLKRPELDDEYALDPAKKKDRWPRA